MSQCANITILLSRTLDISITTNQMVKISRDASVLSSAGISPRKREFWCPIVRKRKKGVSVKKTANNGNLPLKNKKRGKIKNFNKLLFYFL